MSTYKSHKMIYKSHKCVIKSRICVVVSNVKFAFILGQSRPEVLVMSLLVIEMDEKSPDFIFCEFQQAEPGYHMMFYDVYDVSYGVL